MDGAGVDRGERIGDGQVAIVVRVDAERHVDGRGRFLGERGDFLGHAAAVGVAHHDDHRPAFDGGLDRFRGVVGVRLPAVEEVLGVVDHVAAHLAQVGDRLADHRQVFFERNAQHFGHVEIVRLADDRDDGRLRLDERLHAGVVGRLHALAARHAERAQPAVLQRLGGDALKELGVLRIRERVAALDEVEAELIEPPGDEQLVLQAKS